jgi:phosphate transport system substrate-binding protein
VKITRLGVAAAALAAITALAACSSSKSGPSTSTGASADGTTTSPVAGNAATCSSGTLTSEGSTAQANAMTKWINDYQAACSGAKINYSPTGSGQGVSNFNAGLDDFAGSDSALDPSAGEVTKAKQRCGSQPLDLPMVIGPIALAYKINGVSKLVLTADLVAKIFTGKITKWNDPAIAAKNSGVTLPNENINVIYRSDSSGTTANFEKYLAAAAPSVFTATPAKDNAQQVFKGQGKTGSQGVAAAIPATEGSIGYVEFSYAVNGSLATAEIDSGAGAVQVSKDSASAAIADATVAPNGPGDLTLKINYTTKAAGAYPIVLATYEIACTTYKNTSTGTFVHNFLKYTATTGQGVLAGLGYAPLPQSLQQKVVAAVDTIK